MENTRRSFLKKVSAAGIGAAAWQWPETPELQQPPLNPKRKKQPAKMMVNYVSVSSERVLDAMSILIMYWRSPVIRS